jgi:DNA (cytosine-5)-methyltransferase 1
MEIQPKAIEFFSGAGGLLQGIEQAGFETLTACEIASAYRQPHQARSQARNTLKFNRPGLFVWEGIESYSFPSEHYGVDLIAGGPPCQSYSMAGKRAGLSDARGSLLMRFARLIRDLKPTTFMIENVVGLRSIQGGVVLDAVTEMMVDKGYFTRVQTLTSSDFGLAQNRRRLFITGSLRAMPPAVRRLPCEPPTLREAIADLQGSKMHYTLPAPCVMAAVIDPSHPAKRLNWDTPTPTLLTKPGTNRRSTFVHPSENRVLSIEECKRLQGFPSSWQLAGSIRNQYDQLGNAVSVPVAKAVAQSLLATL